jgi:uncharacterized protein YoxC
MTDPTMIGAWLLQAAATLPDTIVTKQVAVQRGWFDQFTAVASGLMSIALLVLAAALVPAAWNWRNSYKKVNQLLERVQGDIAPIMRHASSIADNLDYITTSIRTDVQQVNATIAAANQRLQEAVTLTEERLNEFNALLAVVQQEAEGLFVSTAATARGIRTGASALADDVADTLAPPDLAAGLIDLDDEEGYDGIDVESRGAAGPRPRVRPRRRGWE